MDYFERRRASKNALDQAEKEGRVADSLDYRMDLIRRFKAGEMTFDEMQAELKATKRNAKKQGKITRSQASRGY